MPLFGWAIRQLKSNVLVADDPAQQCRRPSRIPNWNTYRRNIAPHGRGIIKSQGADGFDVNLITMAHQPQSALASVRVLRIPIECDAIDPSAFAAYVYCPSSPCRMSSGEIDNLCRHCSAPSKWKERVRREIDCILILQSPRLMAGCDGGLGADHLAIPIASL